MNRYVHIHSGRVNRTLCGSSTDYLPLTLTLEDYLSGRFPGLRGRVCRKCARKADQQVAHIY